MVKSALEKVLIKDGFEIEQSFEGVSMYIKYTFNNQSYVNCKDICFLINDANCMVSDIKWCLRVMDTIKTEKPEDEVNGLFIVATEHIDMARNKFEGISQVWFAEKGRLVMYEDAPEDFCDIKSNVESTLFSLEKVVDIKKHKSEINKGSNIPIISIVLIAINVLIFILIEIVDSTDNVELMSRIGAMNWREVIYWKKYYELFTSMFLHFGFQHIASNMFMLAILGSQIENIIGRWKFLGIYLLSGIGGGVISCIYHMMINDVSICAGASGAIFGLFGALMVVLYKNRKNNDSVSAPRLILLFALMVFGNISEDIDFAAHFGGAIIGVISTFIIFDPKKSKKTFRL